jgi:hypothetical protein
MSVFVKASTLYARRHLWASKTRKKLLTSKKMLFASIMLAPKQGQRHNLRQAQFWSEVTALLFTLSNQPEVHGRTITGLYSQHQTVQQNC